MDVPLKRKMTMGMRISEWLLRKVMVWVWQIFSSTIMVRLMLSRTIQFIHKHLLNRQITARYKRDHYQRVALITGNQAKGDR